MSGTRGFVCLVALLMASCATRMEVVEVTVEQTEVVFEMLRPAGEPTDSVLTGAGHAGTVEGRGAGWDGDFETYVEAHSNGAGDEAITYSTDERYDVPDDAVRVRLRSKIESAGIWESFVEVHAYNHETGGFERVSGGRSITGGVREVIVDLRPEYYSGGFVKVMGYLFAKHDAAAFARYYESSVLVTVER